MKPEDRPRKAHDVEQFLAAHRIRGVRLVNLKGGFNFEGALTAGWRSHLVEASFLGDLTLGQWLKTYRAMNANPSNRLSVIPQPSMTDITRQAT